MTFSLFETSQSNSKPIFLLKFTDKDGSYYCTTFKKTITYDSNDYLHLILSSSAFVLTSETRRSSITIETVINNGIIPDSSRGVLSLIIYRGNYGDTDYPVFWSGEVTGQEKTGDKLILTCEDIQSKLQRKGKGGAANLTCRHQTFDSGCKLLESSFTTSSTVSSVVDSKNINVAAASSKADGYYNGGKVRIPNGDEYFITEHVGTLLTTLFDCPVSVSDAVDIIAGDDFTAQTCNDKFSNIANFGGHNHLPPESPFNGQAIN